VYSIYFYVFIAVTSESEFCFARHYSIGEIKIGPYPLELKA